MLNPLVPLSAIAPARHFLHRLRCPTQADVVSGPWPRRVTHLAKTPLKMRHKISTNRRNQLEKRILQRHG